MRFSEQMKPTSEEVTKKDDYVRVLSKLTFEATHHDLDKLKDVLKLFLLESYPYQKSYFDKSCVDSIKEFYLELCDILIRVSSEYERLYESKLN